MHSVSYLAIAQYRWFHRYETEQHPRIEHEDRQRMDLSLHCSIENRRQRRDHGVISSGKRGQEDDNERPLARPR